MEILKDRIGKIIKVLKELTCKSSYAIDCCRIIDAESSVDMPSFSDSGWKEFSARDHWGGDNKRFWFDISFAVPDEAVGDTLYFTLITGKEDGWDAINPQFAVYVDGVLRQGFDVNHRSLMLAEKAEKGKEYHIVLSALSGDKNYDLRFIPSVISIDCTTEKYYYDLSVPYQVAWELDDESSQSIEIVEAINNSINLLDLRHPYSTEYYDALEKAQAYISSRLYSSQNNSADIPSIYCVGHTHIDIAWLWTLAVTKEKAVRSFSTVLELMDRYPEYKFMSSQPQLYKYVKKYAPDNYKRIKERVKEGRWEVEGGMFVESDCNIPSGESLVRQFVHGLKFFKDEFDKTNEILWLPDVFGYSAALPQIMKKCNIHYFMTTKISWSETNKMPYDTFMWEGIDGTRILTHFSPCRDNNVPPSGIWDKHRPAHFTTYNSQLTPSEVIGSWKRYSQKALNKEVLICCGHGDGGGGTTAEMLENQRRLAFGIPGSPITKISTASEFFHKLESSVQGNKDLPIWVGELYLEYHRGTYTSMARNKKSNRQSEFMLENAELLSSLASYLLGSAYDSEEIWNIWEIVLRNQFHDILPGSAIKEVYDDSKLEYEEVATRGNSIIKEKLSMISDAIEGKGVVVFNPNGFRGDGIIAADIDAEALTDGYEIFPIQHNACNSIAYVKDIPAKGYRLLKPCEAISGPMLIADKTHIENDLISVEFDSLGRFTSIFDKKNNRELIPEGKLGNVLTVYEDRPHNYDAWDINCYYTEKKWDVDQLVDVSIIECGAVRTSICFTYQYQDSIIKETVSLVMGSPEINIHFDVDWKECYSLLRFALPAAIHSDEATYEIQYGNVRRPTHKNTSWDQAKFEVCMHKWLDFSEGGYGVSVINDCKYGADVHFGTIGVSLIKSAKYPNTDADREKHSFSISILPHAEGWKEAETVKKAYALNNPLIACVKESEEGSLPESFSLISTASENIAIESVKHAYDGNGIIVRCYEYENRRTDALFRLPFSANVYSCNLLEEKEAMLECDKNQFTAEFSPFEINTFRIVPSDR